MSIYYDSNFNDFAKIKIDSYNNELRNSTIYCSDINITKKDIYGTCGKDTSYILNEEGTFTIKGSGAMSDYSSSSRPAWHSNASKITKVVIENDVTSIGNYAFDGCSNLTSVTIP